MYWQTFNKNSVVTQHSDRILKYMRDCITLQGFLTTHRYTMLTLYCRYLHLCTSYTDVSWAACLSAYFFPSSSVCQSVKAICVYFPFMATCLPVFLPPPLTILLAAK